MRLPAWDRFQFMAIVTVIGAFALMVAGGFVTQTGAGLGCPDWPLCGGSLVPDWSNPLMVTEWTHRTVAAIVGVFVLLTTWFAWRDRRRERRIVFAATLALILVIIQAGLGGATVLSELHPALVVVHLSFAALFFAMTVITAVLALILPRPTPAAGASARVVPAEDETRA